MPDIEVIVPWRGGCQHREAALPYILTRYAASGIGRVTVAEAPAGEWIKAAAVTPAVEASSAEVVVVADGDVWSDRTLDAIEAVTTGTCTWATPHDRVRRLSFSSTAMVIAGAADLDDPTLPLAEPEHLAAVGGGITVIRRDTYLDIPLDPRFVGWGGEDFAWGIALVALAGTPWRPQASLFHLWHPPQRRIERNFGSQESLLLLRRYQRDHTNPVALRALVDEAKR